MTDERPITPQEAIARAGQAERILTDPLFRDAMERIKSDCIDSWRTSPVRDNEGREWLWFMLKSAERFEAVFTEAIATGTLAAQNLRIDERERKFTDLNFFHNNPEEDNG